jgi:hypothetical protein
MPPARALIVASTPPAIGTPSMARLKRLVEELGRVCSDVDVATLSNASAAEDETSGLGSNRPVVGRSALLRDLLARGMSYRVVVTCGWEGTHRALPMIRALAPQARVVADAGWQDSSARDDPEARRLAEVARRGVDALLALDEMEQRTLRALHAGLTVLDPADTASPDSPVASRVAVALTAPTRAEPSASMPAQSSPPAPRGRVLVLGVYLVDRAHNAPALAAAFASAGEWVVDQRWAAIGTSVPPDDLRAATTLRVSGSVSKFTLINRLSEGLDLGLYDWLIVTDDDIEVPVGFVDRFLALAGRHKFALAQPARTHDSYIDHHFVAALTGVDARRTTFVEIGPLFAVAAAAFGIILPFDETAPMGWGLDSVWPVQLAEANLPLGIVDATPVRHALRRPVSFYSYREARKGRTSYLRSRAHLPLRDAFVALETYAASDSV